MTRAQMIEATRARLAMLTVTAPPAKGERELFLQIGRKRQQVASLREASDIWSTVRNEAMQEGMSSRDMPRVTVVSATGTHLYSISWNGAVWEINHRGERVEVAI